LRFAVHRPGNPEASTRSHGMPCRDVPGRVHVSVVGISAGSAGEDGLALTRLRVDDPAHRAPLACVHGIDLFHSAMGLVLKPTGQQPPSAGQDLSVEPSLLPDVRSRRDNCAFGRASHVGDPKVLNADHVETPGQVSGYLLGPVLTRISLPCYQPGCGGPGPDSAFGNALGAGQAALQKQQSATPLRTQSGDVEQLAGGQSCAHRHAAIYTNDSPVAGRWDGRRDDGECNVPAARAVTGYPVGPRAFGDGPGPAESDPPGLWHPRLGRMTGQPTDPLSLWPDDTEALVAADLPPGGPAMGPGEEACHCLREVPQRLLLDSLRPGSQPGELGAGLGELAALGNEPGRGGAAESPVLVLLHSKIPHEPGVRTVFPQDQFLPQSRHEPVTGHESNLLATTDTFEEVTRRHVSRLKARISTPRSR
jgi:hypothetical protein